jgi:hypothetical protein
MKQIANSCTTTSGVRKNKNGKLYPINGMEDPKV